MFTVVGELVKQERLTIKNVFSSNNSVTSGHLLRTEKGKATLIRLVISQQTRILGFAKTSKEKENGMTL